MSEVTKIGVVGLGTMGLGIAQVFAQAGFEVLAADEQPAARDAAPSRLALALEDRVKAGKLSAEEQKAAAGRFRTVSDLAELASATLVIEAVIERLEAKRALFRNLESIVARNAILATNTSSLSVRAIAEGLNHPARVVGLHFFNPAPAMKLVELVATAETDPAALATARRITEAAGKTVIGCADRPGFIVNRCARPYYGEALAMLEEGRTPSDIDAAMLQAGYRLGPFSLIDLVGADINLAASEGLSAAMEHNPRYNVFDALRKQVAEGKLGRKSGRGFLFPDKPGAAPLDASAITLRIEAVLANEAASLAGESGLALEAVDTALKLGLNFPRGAFEAARVQGVDRIRATLAALESSAPPCLKGRYVAVPALERLS